MNEVIKMLQQIVAWAGRFIEMVWNWTGGQVLKMFQLPFGTLPLWKQVLYLIVAAAVAYLIWKVFTDILEAVQKVLSAGVGLFAAIVANLYEIVLVGAIAFAGAWMINTLKIPVLDAIKF